MEAKKTKVSSHEKAPPPRVDWSECVIRDIRIYQKATGMKFTVIGNHATGNARLWENLMKGGTMTLRNADRLYSYLNEAGAEYGLFFNS